MFFGEKNKKEMKPDEAEFKITMTNLLIHFLAAGKAQYNQRSANNSSTFQLVDCQVGRQRSVGS